MRQELPFTKENRPWLTSDCIEAMNEQFMVCISQFPEEDREALREWLSRRWNLGTASKTAKSWSDVISGASYRRSRSDHGERRRRRDALIASAVAGAFSMGPWVVDLVMIAVIVGWALQVASVAISIAGSIAVHEIGDRTVESGILK
jgi:hypothetical protein